MRKASSSLAPPAGTASVKTSASGAGKRVRRDRDSVRHLLMPRILIAGCGYVGLATAHLFQSAGWAVEGWTATKASADRISEDLEMTRMVDLTSSEAVKSAADAVDVVIHCASTKGGVADDYRRIYFEGTKNLLSALPDAYFLFTSSTSVYAQTDQSWVTEESPADPIVETARILRETEELVLAHGGKVARLAGVYGPGRSHLLRTFLDGTAKTSDDDDRFLNQIHRDDAASALRFVISRDHEIGSATGPAIFNVTDDRPKRRHDCFRWLAGELEQPFPLAGSDPPRRRGHGNKRVSNKKLRALGWIPRYPTFEVGMRESVIPSLAGHGA